MSDLNLATIKGAPWSYHLKRSGAWSALCGRQPGSGTTSMGRRRVGWYTYSSVPNMRPEFLCVECAKAVEATVSVVDGVVVDRLLSPVGSHG